MIGRRWRRVQPGEYEYVVGGMIVGGVYRDTQGRWQWYAEPAVMPEHRRGESTGDPFGRLDSAKAAVVRALGGGA